MGFSSARSFSLQRIPFGGVRTGITWFRTTYCWCFARMKSLVREPLSPSVRSCHLRPRRGQPGPTCLLLAPLYALYPAGQDHCQGGGHGPVAARAGKTQHMGQPQGPRAMELREWVPPIVPRRGHTAVTKANPQAICCAGADPAQRGVGALKQRRPQLHQGVVPCCAGSFECAPLDAARAVIGPKDRILQVRSALCLPRSHCII